MHPDFGLVATAIAAVLFVYALFVEPLWGRSVYRRLTRRREDDPAVLVRTFRLTIGTQWAWVALVLLAVAVAPGLPLSDLGVRLPRADPLVFTLAGALVVALLASAFARRSAARHGTPAPVPEGIAAMLPRTMAERRYAAVVAVTAGTCEETLYRGFFIAAGTGPAHLPLVAAGAVSVAVFALAHVYQGIRQVLTIAALAVVFTLLYLRSGSLLVPVLVHVFIDLNGLLLVSRTVRPAA
jgi:membrane protease YdiL (CAAX protease family)